MVTQIDPISTPPTPADPPEVFEEKASRVWSELYAAVPKMNLQAQEVEALAQAAAVAKEAAQAGSDVAMGYRNEARAARDVAAGHAVSAAADADAAGADRAAADQAADSAGSSADRAAAAAAAAEGVLVNAVMQTSATGAAIFPEGTQAERPDPIPAEGLLVRGNKTTGKPEWYNRAKSAWQTFGDGGGEMFNYAWHNGPRSSIATLTPGRIPADGQQITLLQYPEAVQAILAGKQNVVTEATWQADPSRRNCWSMGDGSTWVRVPDLNAAQAGTGKSFYLRGGTDALNSTSVGDAIRNITGTVSNLSISGGTAGAFGVSAPTPDTYGLGGTLGSFTRGNLDASRVVPTADENRVKTAYGVMTVRIFTEASNASSVDAATLATQLAVVDAKAQVLDAQVQALEAATGFTIIYPNGGTSGAPASVAVNSRYVIANPFPGHQVLCIAEIQVGGVWGESGWAYASGGYGVKASQSSTEGIVVRTGGVALAGAGADTGGSFTITSAITAPTPSRVKVWKLKGAV